MTAEWEGGDHSATRTSSRHMSVTPHRENVAPGGLKQSRTWCEHTLPHDTEAEQCAPHCPIKTGCGRHSSGLGHRREAVPLITSNPGMAGHQLKRKGWTPVRYLCQDGIPFPQPRAGLALILLSQKHVTNDPSELLPHRPQHTALKGPGSNHCGLL